MLPHGGPQSADDGGFDIWTEFLASRGDAVLQVNFRGSDGYGHDFRAAGLKRWGLEMQDDLTDGVAWAIAQRIADPPRVCIVGASYCGYAALMDVVHGTQDRRVPVEQSETMAKALKSAGKPFRYIEQEGGDHHLSRYEDRLQFFKAMESFLDEHLRAGAAPVVAGKP